MTSMIPLFEGPASVLTCRCVPSGGDGTPPLHLAHAWHVHVGMHDVRSGAGQRHSGGVGQRHSKKLLPALVITLNHSGPSCITWSHLT